MSLPKVFEVRNDYIDDNNYCHIDVYESEDENVEGKTVAIVCYNTGKVFYIDALYSLVPSVKEMIDKTIIDYKNTISKKLSDCFQTLLYSWGGDTPPEAIWTANDFLKYFSLMYKELKGLEFQEDDINEVNPKILDMLVNMEL